MDYAALPPEINSGRMYTGPGAGPMLAAALAWEELANELFAASANYQSVISDLIAQPWLGPSALTMAAAVAPYVLWLTNTAEQSAQSAAHAKAAAAAYEQALAMTVPPPVIAVNRALTMALVATNFLGQNTPAIAAAESDYAEMWAQDATAMYGYAAASAAASALTPFEPPPSTTNAEALGGQLRALSAVGRSSTVNVSHSFSELEELVASIPSALHNLASPGSSLSHVRSLAPQAHPWLKRSLRMGRALRKGSKIALKPAKSGMKVVANDGTQKLQQNAGEPQSTSGSAGFRSLTVGVDSVAGGHALDGQSPSQAAPAGLGQATTIGTLSVPQSWTPAAPPIKPVVLTWPSTDLGAARPVAADDWTAPWTQSALAATGKHSDLGPALRVTTSFPGHGELRTWRALTRDDPRVTLSAR